MARLGVTPTSEGYTVAANGRETKGQQAMYMVLNQRMRNKNFQRKDTEILEMVRQGGDEFELLQTEGADLLLLHCLEAEGVKDCGRYFQEEVRRNILRTRIEGWKLMGREAVTFQDKTDLQLIQMSIKGLEEAFLYAEDIFKMIGRKEESVFLRRIKQGSFLHRITAQISGTLSQVGEYWGRVADNVPSGEPPIPRLSTPLAMPDFFREFERT